MQDLKVAMTLFH